MRLNTKQLQDILVKGHYVAAQDFESAKKQANSHVSLLDVLYQKGVLTSQLLAQAVAESVGLPYIDLNIHCPTKEVLQLLPEAVAQEHRLVPFEVTNDSVSLATDEPLKGNLLGTVEALFFPKQVKLFYAAENEINTVLLGYKHPLQDRIDAIIQSSQRIAPELLDQFFSEALSLRTTDIHFEPRGTFLEVRFRIDGLLYEMGNVPIEYAEGIINRLKVSAHLRTDDHFSAQDGAIRYEYEHQPIDVRMSVIPTVNGEKITLRLLAQYVKGSSLDDLGLNARQQTAILQASKKPFGMIIVSGPTGSGKTTTLYTLIKLLNIPSRNITSIEDPVEYRISRLNQIQVNPKTSLTFARGLKSIVRQDPDIIFVGEIRERETAEIAVNASLTGHLLLSSFNATDAAATIPRLLDMEIPPFLIASTLEMIIAQRLVRTVCPHCRTSYSQKLPQLKQQLPQAKLYFPNVVTLYKGKGCKACQMTGYLGRSAIFEYLGNSLELQRLILNRATNQEIAALARKQGLPTLFEDGIEKVKNGITTIEELLRVAQPPQE